MKEFKKYKILKRLGRACYLIQKDSAFYTLKLIPPPVYQKQKLSRFIFGGSLPFQNEFRILNLIKNYDTIPQLPMVENKENEYFISPFINHAQNFNELDIEVYRRIGESVAEISNLPKPKKWWKLKEYFFQRMISPSLNFEKNLKQIEQERKIATSTFIKLHSHIENISKSIKHRLIHNDLADNNIVVGQNNDIYIIDWEDAHIEDKAIFLDLISISFNYNDFSLNEDIVNSFWLNYELDEVENKYCVELLAYNYLVYLYKIIQMKRFEAEYKDRIQERLVMYSKDINKLYAFITVYLNV